MEANRIWHDPVVEVYSNLITPGVSCSAAAYDLANRRWYQINIGDPVAPDANWRHSTRLTEVPEDEWLCSILEKHIKNSTITPPSWNTINTNSSGSPVTFTLSEEALVRRPIMEWFSYGHRPSDMLPTTRFSQLRDKVYLGRGADYCFWNDRKCVFKRIEFDCDVESHETEIRTRETIIQCVERNGKEAGTFKDSLRTSKDHNREMERHFNVVPILAVVLHDETSKWIVSRPAKDDSPHVGVSEHPDDEVAGFLMPYAGRSLDLLSTAIADPDSCEDAASTVPAEASSAPTVEVPVSEEHLLDLACGVHRLSKCGITHGDICHWNVVFTQSKLTASWATRLLLIDLGDVAPDYQGDADALGNFFLWCLGRSAGLKDDDKIKKRVMASAILLKDGDFDRAIRVLSPSKTRSRLKRPPSPIDDETKRRRV